jgi:hypothetical protein
VNEKTRQILRKVEPGMLSARPAGVKMAPDGKEISLE